MSTAAGRSFKPIFMASLCAAGALGCYLVSLNVASERAKLESVEHQIVLAQRDVRLLQTEIGTRGRLAQLERWNVKVLALSAPSADQFLKGGFELARLARPQDQVAIDAPVVLASAEMPAKPGLDDEVATDEATPLPQPRAGALPPPTRAVGAKLSQASLTTEIENKGTREVPAKAAPAPQSDAAKKSTDRTTREQAASGPSSVKGSKDKPGLAAAQKGATDKKVAAQAKDDKSAPKRDAAKPKDAPKKTVDKAADATKKPVTKPAQLAKADPLAPLPEKPRAATHKDASTKR